MKTNQVSLDYVMAIVAKGATASRTNDLRDAKEGIDKQADVRKSAKQKIKDIKINDEELNEIEAGNTGLLHKPEDIYGGFFGFRNEEKFVREGRATNVQAKKSAEQLSVDAEEELGRLQTKVQDVTEAFSESDAVIQDIQEQLKMIDQVAFGES